MLRSLEKQQEVTTKTGRRVRLRPVSEDDAADLLDLLEMVVAEQIYIGMEMPPTDVKDERGWIRQMQHRRRVLPLVAEDDGRVVGMLTLTPGSFGRKDAHVASLGMMVAPSRRGMGIGSAMVEYAIAWARRHDYEKIHLQVFSSNERALALYRKLGFVEEGRRRKAFRLPDVGYADGVMMGLFLRDE